MNPTTELAVVVPVGPGDQTWRTVLPQLISLVNPAQIRLVFSDAVEHATARALALEGDVALLLQPPGRGGQMNAGAAACSAPWLWFLHADSCLDAGTAAAFHNVQADQLWYFDLRFASDGPRWMWLNAIGALLRTRALNMPFGDQGFCLRRDRFVGLGGFQNIHGEDHAFLWQARAAGLKLRPIGAALTTSARRYAEHGWLRTTWHYLRLSYRQAWQFSRGPFSRTR
jgi:hypothetical protein